MNVANALIAYDNVTDESVLSGGAWVPTLSLANLKNRIVGKVARSVDLSLASTKLTLDAGTQVPVRTVSLVNHNFSLTAKYRIKFSNDANFAELLGDSGWLDVWPSVYASTNLPWGSANFWGGKYSERDRKGYTWTSVFSLDFSAYCRYISIEIDDVNNSNGFIQFGRLFAGEAWQPKVNMSLGAGIGWQSDTQVQKSSSGAEFFDEKRSYRLAKFITGFMDDADAMGQAFDIKRRMGLSGEVIFVFDPEDTTHSIRRQFYGRLRELSLIEYPYVNAASTAWEIKELI